jgi:predicted nucleic acid-binding protein
VVNAYPDTSFLFSLYFPQEHSARAAAHFAAMGEPLSLTSLNRFELANAIQLALFRRTIQPRNANTGMGSVKDDLRLGATRLVSCDWAAAHGRALQIAVEHTAKKGCRGIDVLHLAAALEMGATEFLTFDVKQGTLAKAIGLKLPLG